jgi:hypothetical protein
MYAAQSTAAEGGLARSANPNFFPEEAENQNKFLNP